MKILFVNAVVRIESKYIPIGTALLATILRTKGYDVEIIDFNHLYNLSKISDKAFDEQNFETFGNYLLQKSPDIICFYTMSNSYHTSILLSKYIKKSNPTISILFGGPQASVTAYETMEVFPWIDAIGIGEGEKSIEKIVRAIKGKGSFSDIKGVCYRKNGKIIVSRESDLIENLDELPYLDYTLIPYIDKLEMVPIEVGRGCPFECKYCSTKTFWKQKFRLKSTQRIIEEIKYLHKNYGVRKFGFIHDLFTVNKQKVIEFCDELQKENLNIEWGCSSRIDTLDEDIIRVMREAGCNSIFLGIESGSEKNQNLTKKRIKLDNIWKNVVLLKKYKYHIKASFIYGFPGEEMEDVKKTLNLIKKFLEEDILEVQMHSLSILPGTEFFNEYFDQLIPIPKYYYSNFNNGASPQGFEKFFLQKPEIFSQFYMVKGSIIEKLKYLDHFINFYLIFLFVKYKLTYTYLLEYYKGDLFEMFVPLINELERFNTFVIDCNNRKIKKKEMLLEIPNVIARFIQNQTFGDHDTFIKDIFKFENSIFELTYTDESQELEDNYMYDVIKIKQELLPMSEYKKDATKLRIFKIKDNTVKVQKILPKPVRETK